MCVWQRLGRSKGAAKIGHLFGPDLWSDPTGDGSPTGHNDLCGQDVGEVAIPCPLGGAVRITTG